MKRIGIAQLLALSALVLGPAGCATTPRGTTSEVVERLFEAREGFRGARSLASVRVTGRGGQSFRAAIAVNAAGDMTLSALTPFGTTAAQIRMENDRVTIINHLRNQYWQGSVSDMSGINPLAGALRVQGLPFLLTGLPPWRTADGVRQEVLSEDLVRLARGNLTIISGRSGIVSGRLEIGWNEVNVQYATPGIPPSRLEVTSSLDPTRIVQFEHLNLSFEPVTLDPVRIPSDYQRVDHWESLVR